MKSKEVVGRFHSDAMHGWLAVDAGEVMAYEVEAKISRFSYHDAKRGVVFLEEDCDMPVFIRAVESAGDTVRIIEMLPEPAARDSFVRSLPYYSRAVLMGEATR